MATRRTDQEWLAIFQQCERSSLTQSEFCRQHNICSSTFFAKRSLMKKSGQFHQSQFIQAQIIEQTHRQIIHPIPANMTLMVNNIELSIPQGTPVSYVAELIGALSV